MKVKDFIHALSLTKKELQDKKIFIQAPNGLLMAPHIKIKLKDETDIFKEDNAESIILSWE